MDGGFYNDITYCAIENHSNTIFFTAEDLVLHCRFDTLEQNVALLNTHYKQFICVCHKQVIELRSQLQAHTQVGNNNGHFQANRVIPGQAHTHTHTLSVVSLVPFHFQTTFFLTLAPTPDDLFPSLTHMYTVPHTYTMKLLTVTVHIKTYLRDSVRLKDTQTQCVHTLMAS